MIGGNLMSIEEVKKETCSVCRKDLDKQIDKIDVRITNHDAEIIDLKIISDQLLTLQKQNAIILRNIENKQEIPSQLSTSLYVTIFEQVWFKYIICTICIVIILIVGSAIGQNAFSDYLEVLKTISK